MNILGSLLPGLRDLRAPLASGYLWLLFLWIVFGDNIPTSAEATGVMATLVRLGDVVPEAGLAIAVSFVAYLIGIFTGAGAKSVLKWSTFLREDEPSSLPAPGWPSHYPYRNASYEYQAFVLRQLTEDNVRDDHKLSAHDIDMYVRTCPGDLSTIRSRVMADHATLYGEYDRLASESKFRFAMLFPLMAIVIAVAAREDPLWLIALLPIPWLGWDALRLEEQAVSALFASVTSGKTGSPTVERAKAFASRPERQEIPEEPFGPVPKS